LEKMNFCSYPPAILIDFLIADYTDLHPDEIMKDHDGIANTASKRISESTQVAADFTQK
jgi:hypothetical protein